MNTQEYYSKKNRLEVEAQKQATYVRNLELEVAFLENRVSYLEKEAKPLTVDKLLLTKSISGNQTELAKLLNVNRGTLRGLIGDDGERHEIRYKDKKYQLMTVRGLG